MTLIRLPIRLACRAVGVYIDLAAWRIRHLNEQDQ